MIIWLTQDTYRDFSLWIRPILDLKLAVVRLFATKVVLKQAATNVSQDLYNKLDFLSHFKSGIINRGV